MLLNQIAVRDAAGAVRLPRQLQRGDAPVYSDITHWRFREDFRRFHGVVEGSGSEAEQAWLNLVPITEAFQMPVR
jgi:hypothetical protein